MLDHSALTSRQLVAFLEYLTILLFVSAGLPGLRKRYRLRRAAIVVYALAILAAISLTVLWLAGIDLLP